MEEQREHHAKEKGNTDGIVERDDIMHEQVASNIQPSANAQNPPKHSEKSRGYTINELKEYITEIPFPIGEKTGIMKQFLSGIEKLFAIVKSSLQRAMQWLTRKTSKDEEKV
ncbi:uncharacterized protein Eint_071170 [Encephalitozoon intestinalis ATCC 50506]|uniref:Uncharacterized protein n=1 Tax=Encephalitozoon intestinalis (strain ATCC 50506) TaxID=876142 RepID=E0S845_ENCIT|nr:uncharacterized protein Eint_071170 [Encephalitozoon intestinalis ATCC 50506]ADM11880.1 hypothetical protein Eint_071170 [Encephalitozoon intestinalis ATCC 50506]UTX45636.1 hypothetical protein GPK93_07g12010 [Encephalitozoon intestinalis]